MSNMKTRAAPQTPELQKRQLRLLLFVPSRNDRNLNGRVHPRSSRLPRNPPPPTRTRMTNPGVRPTLKRLRQRRRLCRRRYIQSRSGLRRPNNRFRRGPSLMPIFLTTQTTTRMTRSPTTTTVRVKTSSSTRTTTTKKISTMPSSTSMRRCMRGRSRSRTINSDSTSAAGAGLEPWADITRSGSRRLVTSDVTTKRCVFRAPLNAICRTKSRR